MIQFLDLKAQQTRLGAPLRARIDAVLAHCQFVLGPEVAELETRLAAYAGAAHCVSVSSGTDALQIAMMAEGIGRGHAVFLPAFTYTATAEVPLVLGATPVFVDVDRGFAPPYRQHQGAGRAETACGGRRGFVRPAGGLAGLARRRGSREPVSAG
jgi:dTDP-4-amino-4,6-dideoxygalactose transaminase